MSKPLPPHQPVRTFFRMHLAGIAVTVLVVFQFAVLAYVCPTQAGLVDEVSDNAPKPAPATLDVLDKRECDRYTIA